MTTKSGSLRDLYIDPSSAWSFNTSPAPNGPGAPVPPQANGAPAYQWSSRPSNNSIFDLSPDLDLSDAGGGNGLNFLKAMVASAVLQYANTAVVMPWEVANVLLQVQWVPRDAGEPSPEPELVEEEVDDAVRPTLHDHFVWLKSR
jgi:mitochondrial fusion and transport protein UGO1